MFVHACYVCVCVYVYVCVCSPRFCFQGDTPVNSAADNGHVECIRALAELKADVNTRDKNGIAMRGHPRVFLIPIALLTMYNLNSHILSRLMS